MAFDAGGALLSASELARRVRERGPHFHLVASPGPAAGGAARFMLRPPTILPGGGFLVAPLGGGGPPRSSAGPAATTSPAATTTTTTTTTTTKFKAPQQPAAPRRAGGLASPRKHQSRGDDTVHLRSLNRAVYSEWEKGMGCAWVDGVPNIFFRRDDSSFQLGSEDVSESGLAAALDTLENAALDNCLAEHLAQGGDDRLHLTPDPADAAACPAVNKYYCPPRPVPDAYIMRSSCTCSPPSPDGFEAARLLLRDLWKKRVTFGAAFHNTRRDLSRLLGLRVPHEVLLHPSGSDAELIPLLVADVRARALGCDVVVNIVVAAGEVGSGTAPASAGRHFSKYAPCGAIVECGGVVDGFSGENVVVEVKPRTADGDRVVDYDKLIADAVQTAARDASVQGKSPFFVVHAVDGSKTGLRLPSRGCLAALKTRLGQRMLVCMDACQCRSEAEEIDWFLREGAVVLVTSSKFYGAPGFCGAVLLPTNACADLAALKAPPPGLRDYLTKYEVPNSLRALHDSLPPEPINVGLLMRWACGLAEMELFAQHGRAAKDAMRDWVQGVRALVSARAPALGLIDGDHERFAPSGESALAEDRTRFGGLNSIVSVKFLGPCGKRHLTADMLRKVHRWLTVDASALLPARASDADRAAAARQCYVGQPVKLGDYGVLRLAIGAVLARDIAAVRNGLATALADDARVLDKMMVLAKYCEDILG